jgi:hypothetical protein
MLSRRSFVQGFCALSSAGGGTAAAADGAEPTDLDFCDRSAAAQHAGVLGDALRYVDHEVFGDAAGIMIEDSADNGVEDAGFGASPPSGWQMRPETVLPDIYTATFAKTALARGQLRLQGRAAGDCTITLGSDRHFAIAAGDLLTGSLAIRLAQGDVAQIGAVGLIIAERDGSGRIANTAPVLAPVQQLAGDKAWWAQARITVGQSGFASLVLKVITTGAFDLVFDIHTPQLEKRGWRSTFCAASRAADTVIVAPSADYLSRPERTVVITADAPRQVAAATLWSEWRDADNFVEIRYRDHVVSAQSIADGVASEIRLGVVPPLMRFTVAMIRHATGLAASLNGKPVQSVACAMPRGLTRVTLGDGTHGRWNSTVARLTLHASALADAASASRRLVTFYDDFDRPDAAELGDSPTGQAIARVGANHSAIAGRQWVAMDGPPDAVSAAYGKVALPQVPRYLGAVVCWTTGNSGGAAGLIAASNDMSASTDALHSIVTDTAEIFQTITLSQVDAALARFVYPVAMRRDGATPYGVACLLNAAESAVVYVGPQGDLARHVSSTYAARAGRFAVFEHYWQPGQCRPAFLAVAAE